jgi:alpha-L-fucosidase 2
MAYQKIRVLALLIVCTLFLTLALYGQKPTALKLWYDKPADAKVWEQALPVGNGRLGAMVYGIPEREMLQLNEETIWGGGAYRNDNKKGAEALPVVQQLIFDGNTHEADELVNASFFTKTHGMPFQTAGSLVLNFPGHAHYQHYYRELDLDRAIAKISYTVDGIRYTREIISSFADDVIIMHLASSKKGGLTFEAEYSNSSKHTVFRNGNSLVLEGRGSDHEGVDGKIVYQTHTSVKSRDGKIEVANDKLKVSGATSATLYISIGTNFIDYKSIGADQAAKASVKLGTARKKGFEKALSQHVALYAKQFGRFKLDLGSRGGVKDESTVERIKNFKTTQDPALITLLTQFGRYLLICSSQPGGQPATLQGIWNNAMQPAWDSKYTININTEMNYWPAEVTNLSETHQPLFQMIKDLGESGQETAKALYGSEGWVAHHNTDIWRITSPIDFAAAGMWPMGGIWLAQHLWEHYLYTGNTEFLRQVYPIMKGASDFLLTTLIPHPKHEDKEWMVLSPSISPEHGPMSAGVTMDNQLVFDMLTRTALANEILGEDTVYRDNLQEMVKRIPPMHIGKYTQLQEWLEDLDDPKNEHRHVSHLYGLYPGNQISPYTTPDLFEASRNSLTYRGDMATGWSIGWKVNLWARLLDGNHAYKIVNNMLTIADRDNRDGRTYPNMFTAHPPFQIDGNFGLTAGVAEMLLQSHDGAVHLLPAMPDVWHTGFVSGIKARGGFEIDMNWVDGEAERIKVLSSIGGNLRLRSYVPLSGKGLKEATGENPNVLLNPIAAVKALISPEASLKGNKLRRIYEYDLPTIRGKTYNFSVKKR